MRLREGKCLGQGQTMNKWTNGRLGLISGFCGSKAFAVSSPRLYVGFGTWSFFVCGFLCLVAACLTTTSLLQSLIGDIDNAMRTFLNYYTVWKQFGGLPEFYNIPQGYTVEKREGYPLRPGKQDLWPITTRRLWFSEPQTLTFLWGSIPHKYSQADFFPIWYFQGSGWLSW